MRCIKTIFVVETVNCFLDVFFKSPKFISILPIPQTIPLFRSNYILSSFDFCYVNGRGPIYEGEKEENPSLGKDGESKDTKVQKKY